MPREQSKKGMKLKMDKTVAIPSSIPKKSKVKIYVYSLKKNLLTIIFAVFCIFLVAFSNSNLAAAKNGLILWATAVVPSLFPFFVATELLSYTNIIAFFGKWLTPIVKPLLGIPGEGVFAFLMGLISGYPVGAKIVAHLKKQELCTKEEAERMLAFTNNSGPLFIIGTVGISLFGNTSVGILLFVTHVLACISVGIILNILRLFNKKRKEKIQDSTRQYSYRNTLQQCRNTSQQVNKKFFQNNCHQLNKETNSDNKENSNICLSSLGEILGKSITNSISTVLMIGGFVVIFSVIISILNQSHLLSSIASIFNPLLSLLGIPIEFSKAILSGIVELTNGVNLVAAIPMKEISTNIILCAFLLGFGGFSVLLQVWSIVSKSGLRINQYFIGKLLQGILAAFYTFLALQFIPMFFFNL